MTTTMMMMIHSSSGLSTSVQSSPPCWLVGWLDGQSALALAVVVVVAVVLLLCFCTTSVFYMKVITVIML